MEGNTYILEEVGAGADFLRRRLPELGLPPGLVVTDLLRMAVAADVQRLSAVPFEVMHVVLLAHAVAEHEEVDGAVDVVGCGYCGCAHLDCCCWVGTTIECSVYRCIAT